MNLKRKKLIELRAALKVYKEIDKKLVPVLDADIELEDVCEDIFYKIENIEEKISNLKIEMNLSDDEWDEDEN